MAKKQPQTNDCYCGSKQPFVSCCQPIIEGQAATTAEQLMRSRYSAFCIKDKDFLLASWHHENRPDKLDFDEQQQWLGLKILKVQDGSELHQAGIVEFVARYKINGKASRLHEISQFVNIDGQWFYSTGDLLES